MNKFRFIYSLFAGVLLYVILSSHSGGMASQASSDKTGAPSGGLCGDCHSGGSFGTVTTSIQVFTAGTTNPITSYQPGTTYDIQVSIAASSGSPSGYGFEMTCLTTPGNVAVAGYSTLSSNVKQKKITSGTFNGRTYVEHSGISSSNTFTMQWTAPVLGTGSVKFYACGNAVNSDGSTTGDKTGNTSLTIKEVLSVSGTTTDIACFGSSTGSINITAKGGTSPYRYAWSNGSTAEDISTLSAGTYSVTVTDNTGATAGNSFTLQQPASALAASGSVTHVVCKGGNNGSITITTNGGSSPYTYSWNDGVTTEDRSNLSSNSYTLTVTDNKGCTNKTTYSVTEPSSSMNTSALTENVPCFGDSSGSIDITISNGTAPYSYNWSNGSSAEDLSSLPAGTYTLSLSDQNGCSASGSYTLTQPDKAFSITYLAANISCFGEANGSIQLLPDGGSPPYHFIWDDASSTEAKTSLAAGSYSVTALDAMGCRDSLTISMNEPDPLALQLSADSILCFDSSSHVFISGAGGTEPYAGTGIFIRTAGSYEFIITDSMGCSDSAILTLGEPSALLLSVMDTAIIPCNGGIDSLLLVASGGTPPYSNTGYIHVSSPGVKTYLIEDNNGCIAADTGIALAASGLEVFDSIKTISCSQYCDGAISLQLNGGNPPFSFSWSTTETTEDISSLCSGEYTLTITDNINCGLHYTYMLNEPEGISANMVSDSIRCFGDSVLLKANIIGGTPPYTFLWNTGESTDSLNVVAGTYSLVIGDSKMCSDTTTIAISNPTHLLTQFQADPILCFGDSATLKASVIGGSPPYSYQWNTGATIDSLSVMAGMYSLIIEDSKMCSDTSVYVISGPSPLLAEFRTDSILCFGDSTWLKTSVSGGSGPYSYVWNTTETTDSIKITAGTFQLIIQDIRSCEDSFSLSIGQPDSIQLTIDSIGHTGIGISISGGTEPYQFSWSTGASTEDLSALSAGTYSLSVTDRNGCEKTISNLVVENTGIQEREGFIQVHPNPFNETIRVYSPLASGKEKISVYSIEGRKMMESYLYKNLTELQTQTWPEGIYILHYQSDSFTKSIRLVK